MIIIRRVVGCSMQPALSEGDIVVASTHKKPAIGDIVVAKLDVNSPSARPQTSFAGGETLNNSGEKWHIKSNQREIIKRIVKMSGKKYYLVGDNRLASTDSRQFGAVDPKNIKATVVLKLRLPTFSKRTIKP